MRKLKASGLANNDAIWSFSYKKKKKCPLEVVFGELRLIFKKAEFFVVDIEGKWIITRVSTGIGCYLDVILKFVQNHCLP